MCYNSSQQLIFAIEYKHQADIPETMSFFHLAPHYSQPSIASPADL